MKIVPVDQDYLDSLGTLAREGGGDILSPEFSEDQLALHFTARHGADLRYVAAWSKWFQWTGTHWEHENTLGVFDMTRKICREAASQCNKPSEAKAIAKAKTVAAVEQLARSDRAAMATIEQWDADKALLNAPGGTVNHKTGALQPHRREDYCTKITAVSPGGTCSMFLDFLRTIFMGDNELIERRRFHLIPFTVTIPEPDRDPYLAEKLKAEWPGILQWMCEGTVRWQIEGLDKPPAVENATRQYLEAEDTLLAWIEDRCECGKNRQATASELFASWKAWSELTGEFTGTAKVFGQRLEDHGFQPARATGGVKMWRGLSLIETATSPVWQD